MFPKHHIFLGTIFAAALFLIFPKIGLIGFLLIIASAVLMDADHYVYYVFKKRDLSLSRAYKWHLKKQKRLLLLSRKQRNKVLGPFCFLHGIEILFILFLLGAFLSKYFYFLLIGAAFHLFLDIIYQRKIHDRLDRISLIYDFIKFRNIERLYGFYKRRKRGF